MSEALSYADLQRQCAPARILAVSKLQPIEKIRSLYDLGQRDFGENYVQEATQKMDALQDLKNLKWHLIGHLQKNKVKLSVGRFDVIHSVDSLELAQTINRQAETLKITQKVLLEVNLAGEASKTGFSVEDIKKNFSALCALSHLKIEGLMTMPPLTENAESARPYFRELKKLQMDLKSTAPPQTSLAELSMGTSGDFAVALQEGATIVRLGTILFGERAAKR